LSTTRVRSCEQLPENLAGFGPVKYKDVLDGTLNPDYLVGNHIEHSESFDLTPAKRIMAVNIDFEESFDENSATRNISSVKIKKEKFAKSG
ncbi:unnamed protein product, partial [Brassica oleracea]